MNIFCNIKSAIYTMRNAVTCALCVVLCAFAISCSSSHEEIRQRPSLSKYEIDVKVGESETLQVNDAVDITAKISDTSVASLSLSGNCVVVTGLKVGNTELKVTADGNILSCKIRVSSIITPGEEPIPDPEQDSEREAILADASVRFISPSLTMNYFKPGTIVEYTISGGISFRDLSTGDYVNISSETIQINEKSYPISQQTIEKTTTNIVWRRYILQDNVIVWAIVDL